MNCILHIVLVRMMTIRLPESTTQINTISIILNYSQISKERTIIEVLLTLTLFVYLLVICQCQILSSVTVHVS